MDLMELVRNGKGMAVAATAALTAVSFGWWAWRERASKFDDRKSAALEALLKDELWQSVPESELQRAIKRDYGKPVSRRVFAFVYQHDDWPHMLRDLIQAGNWVSPLKVEGQLTDGRPQVLKRIPLGLYSAGISTFGVLGAVVMLLVAFALWNVSAMAPRWSHPWRCWACTWPPTATSKARLPSACLAASTTGSESKIPLRKRSPLVARRLRRTESATTPSAAL